MYIHIYIHVYRKYFLSAFLLLLLHCYYTLQSSNIHTYIHLQHTTHTTGWRSCFTICYSCLVQKLSKHSTFYASQTHQRTLFSSTLIPKYSSFSLHRTLIFAQPTHHCTCARSYINSHFPSHFCLLCFRLLYTL